MWGMDEVWDYLAWPPCKPISPKSLDNWQERKKKLIMQECSHLELVKRLVFSERRTSSMWQVMVQKRQLVRSSNCVLLCL